jgi:hypothetical protein
MCFFDIREEFLKAARQLGVKPFYIKHLTASAALAVNNGNGWREVLESIYRNCPEFFN